METAHHEIGRSALMVSSPKHWKNMYQSGRHWVEELYLAAVQLPGSTSSWEENAVAQAPLVGVVHSPAPDCAAVDVVAGIDGAAGDGVAAGVVAAGIVAGGGDGVAAGTDVAAGAHAVAAVRHGVGGVAALLAVG